MNHKLLDAISRCYSLIVGIKCIYAFENSNLQASELIFLILCTYELRELFPRLKLPLILRFLTAVLCGE